MNENINEVSITYPDLGFAFNPIRVIVNNYTKGGSLTLKVENITIQRELYQGITDISFELSAVARSLFDRLLFYRIEQQDTTLIKTLSFSLNDGENDFYSGTIPVIWGALQIGETFSQSKTLTYFRGLPFTIPFFMGRETTLDVKIDGSPSSPIGSLTVGKYNYPVTVFDAHRKIEIIGSTSSSNGGVFNYTFDYTFGIIKKLSDMHIIINIADCPNEGVYLRWINQHGEYNYYLFTPSVSSSEVKNEDIVLENVFYSTYPTDGYHIGTGKAIGKTITNSQKIFASLIDENTYTLLLGLVKSPVVDMFIGYGSDNIEQWINISLKDGTFTRTQNDLQDFECMMITNDEFIQTV